MPKKRGGAGTKATPDQNTRTTSDIAAPSSTRQGTGGFAINDGEVEAMLLSGENAGALSDYFGAEQYAELRSLARQVNTRAVRGGERVLILPGIMGSKLGHKRMIFSDVIWFDPIAIGLGRLKEIRLGAGGTSIEPVGVILFAYLSLKLRLKLAGYDADFHPYDWRRSIADLGRELAERIAGEGRPVKIVAHSMGGLVARASLAHVEEGQLPRLIMLGTPNFGSYAPVQAFRGAYSVIEKVAWLDRRHSSAELAAIFGTFPGLIEMIPSPGKIGSANLFDLTNWPKQGERPDEILLARAQAVQAALPTGAIGVEIILVAGVNQETVVDAHVEDVVGASGMKEFVYTMSNDGDGTVPLRCCLLPEAKATYYVEGQHGSLPGNFKVQRALPSLLASGQTTDLDVARPQSRASGERTVRESETTGRVAVSASSIPGMEEQRQLLAELAAPAPVAPVRPLLPDDLGSKIAGSVDDEALSDAIIFGRGRPFRLEITVAHGSIVEADAQCYVLGLFKSVAPAGAALALDEALEGAVSNMVRRRMFNGNVGEITILPNGRHPIRAATVAFVGLGSFDSFQSQTLETVGENLSRMFVAGRVDDFAMVPFGGGSGEVPLDIIRKLLRGFLRGLRDADTGRRFRAITICETDAGRFEQIRRALYELAGTKLFDDVELTLTVQTLPDTPAQSVRGARQPRTDRIYLIVREGAQRLEDGVARAPLVASVLTSGGQAAIVSGIQPDPGKPDDPGYLGTLDDHLRTLRSMTKAEDVAAFGRQLGEIVLPREVREALLRNIDAHLVVVHDAAASRVPWETLQIGNHAPALRSGMSHRYEAGDLSVAKFLDMRRKSGPLRLLVVADPLGDLPFAAKEGRRIEEMAKLHPGLETLVLRGAEARKSKLLNCFSSGEFDVIHYAGHAFFDPIQRGRSGLACAEREILSGDDLANISNLPSLMFFNACEAARIRRFDPNLREKTRSGDRVKSKPGGGPTEPHSEHVRRGVGFAESILRGGVANFVGTYWPVHDDAAQTFAETFYPALFGGETISAALNASRAAVHGLGSHDWADYVFYGDPDFLLK